MVQDVVRQGISPATGSEVGSQSVTDFNLRVDGVLYVPVSDDNTLNGGKDRDGAIKLSLNADGDLILNSYADGKWTEYLAVLDGLKSIGGITLDGNEVTIVAPVKWRINSVNYEKLTNTVIAVNSATDGFKRIDYIYADTNGDILLIEGTEVEDGNPYIPPTLPVNTVMVAPVYISGDTVTQPVPDLSGYLKKVDADQYYIRVNPTEAQLANMWISGKASASTMSVGLPPNESGGSLHVRGKSYLDASNAGGGVIFYGVGGVDNGINIGSAAEEVEVDSQHKFLIIDTVNGLLKVAESIPFLPTGGGTLTGKITGSELFEVTDPKDYVQANYVDDLSRHIESEIRTNLRSTTYVNNIITRQPWLAVGDSITEGTLTNDFTKDNWASKVRRVFQSYFGIEDYGFQNFNPYLDQSTINTFMKYTFSGFGASGGFAGAFNGVFYGGVAVNSNTSGDYIEFTYTGKDFSIVYTKNSTDGSLLDISIDSVYSSTLDTKITNDVNQMPVQSDYASFYTVVVPTFGFHTIRITNTQNKSATLSGIQFANNATPAQRPLFNNVGRSSLCMTDLSDDIIDFYCSTGFVIWSLITNDDLFNTDINLFATKFQRVVDNITNNGGELIVQDFLYNKPPSDPRKTILREKTLKAGFTYIDYYTLWTGSAANNIKYGLSSVDQVHPNVAGHQNIGNTVLYYAGLDAAPSILETLDGGIIGADTTGSAKKWDGLAINQPVTSPTVLGMLVADGTTTIKNASSASIKTFLGIPSGGYGLGDVVGINNTSTLPAVFYVNPSGNADGVSVQAHNNSGAGSQPAFVWRNNLGIKQFLFYWNANDGILHISDGSGNDYLSFGSDKVIVRSLEGTGTRPVAAQADGTLAVDTGGARLAGGNVFTGGHQDIRNSGDVRIYDTASGASTNNSTLNVGGTTLVNVTANTTTLYGQNFLQRLNAAGFHSRLTFNDAVTANAEYILPTVGGTVALTSDLTGKANLDGGNTFTGLQLLINGTIQPYNAYSESGFLNTLQSNTLTANVNTYLPEYNGTLATIPTIGGTAPTPTGTGIKGQVIITGGYRYDCIATNTWVRAAVEVTW